MGRAAAQSQSSPDGCSMSSPPANRASLVRNVQVTSSLGPGVFQVQSCHYRESLGHPFQFDLELLSDDTAIDIDALLGRPLTVKVRDAQGGDRFFSGLVRTVEQGGEADQVGLYRVAVAPWIALLQLGADCRIFQDKNALEIVGKVFADCGFSDFDAAALMGRYDPLPYRVQYNESHFDFVHRVLQAVGIYYYHRHGDGTHTLVLCDAPSGHKPFPGHARIPFRTQRSNALVEEHIHALRVRQEMQSGGYATKDYDATAPAADLTASDTASHSYPSGSLERFEYPGGFGGKDNRDAIATSRLAESACRSLEASGSAYSWGLSVGSVFSLDHFPRRDRNGPYLTTSIDLRIERFAADESVSGAGARPPRGFTFRCDFTAIPAAVQFRPKRTIKRPVIAGVQTAVVVVPTGYEPRTPYTDSVASARVQFHWDRAGNHDEKSSCWLRCSQPSAGSGWGSIFLPLAGNEVVVAFLNGDPDRPIIVGNVYNAANLPPRTLPDDPLKTIVQDVAGNFVALDSKEDSEWAMMYSPKDESRLKLGELEDNASDRPFGV